MTHAKTRALIGLEKRTIVSRTHNRASGRATDMKQLVCATVAMAFGACASGTAPAAESPADKILGKWTCKAAAEGMSTEGLVDYGKGGAAGLDAKINFSQGNLSVDVAATGEADWKFLPDGKLEETITKLTVMSGKTGGRDVPPALIQAMVDQLVVNQTSTGIVVFSGASFTSTDENGVVTTCVR